MLIDVQLFNFFAMLSLFFLLLPLLPLLHLPSLLLPSLLFSSSLKTHQSCWSSPYSPLHDLSQTPVKTSIDSFRYNNKHQTISTMVNFPLSSKFSFSSSHDAPPSTTSSGFSSRVGTPLTFLSSIHSLPLAFSCSAVSNRTPLPFSTSSEIASDDSPLHLFRLDQQHQLFESLSSF